MIHILQLFTQQEGEGQAPEAVAAPAASEAGASQPTPATAPAAPAVQMPADAALRQHFDSLQRQAQDLRRQFPDFDLGKALEDPVFLRLTAPGVGVSLEDAYFATHRRQLQQTIVQSVRSRPRENGTGGAAPAVAAFDYRSASPQQRAALKQAIRAAKARGEKLYPGKGI